MAVDEKYQTFWARLCAGFIDGFIFLPLLWIDEWVWQNITAGSILVVWVTLHSISYVSYSVLLHGYFGRTIGKRVMRVKVLDVSGAKLSMGQAVLRDSVCIVIILFDLFTNIPTVASGINPYDPKATSSSFSSEQLVTIYASMLWFLLELTTMLTNSKRRAIHDFIAGSVVLRQRKI